MACIETPTYSPSYDPFRLSFGLAIAAGAAGEVDIRHAHGRSYSSPCLSSSGGSPSTNPSRAVIVLQSSEGRTIPMDLEVLARHSSFIQDMLLLQPKHDEEPPALSLPLPICARALSYCVDALDAMSASEKCPRLPEPLSVYLRDILTFADMLDCADLFAFLAADINPSAIPTRFVVAAVADDQEAVYDLSPSMLRFQAEFDAGEWWVRVLEDKVPAVRRRLEALYAERTRAFDYFLDRMRSDPTLGREGALFETGHRQELCDQYLKCLCTDTDFRTTMATRMWEGFAMEPLNSDKLHFEPIKGYQYHYQHSPLAPKRRPRELDKHIARLDIKCDTCRRKLTLSVEKILKTWPYVSASKGAVDVPPSPGQMDWWHIGLKAASRDCAGEWAKLHSQLSI